MAPVDEHDLTKLEDGIEKLSDAVTGLTVNVATQTMAIQGFRELYELQISNIHKELVQIKELTNKVHAHDLYIAETEGKLKAIGNMVKAGWTVIGTNILALGGFLIKMYIDYKAGR